MDQKLYRTYVITCPNDELNIVQGKCPDYALKWGVKRNLNYWSDGHDFISGKYSKTKEYAFPKNSINISEYERLQLYKIMNDSRIRESTKMYFNEKREKLKKEMEEYLEKN